MLGASGFLGAAAMAKANKEIKEQDVTFTTEELTMQLDNFADKVLQPIINKMADDLREKMKGKSKRQKKKILQDYMSRV